MFKEILCLNSLEDFNTTKADLMELKDDILTMWKSRDQCRVLFTPSSVGVSEKKSTLGDTFVPSKTTLPVPSWASILSGTSYRLGEMLSPLMRPLGPPPGIPYPLVSMSSGQGTQSSKLKASPCDKQTWDTTLIP